MNPTNNQIHATVHRTVGRNAQSNPSLFLIPEKEKKKAKNTRVQGSTRQGPSALPFFGSTSDQVPTAFTQDPAQGKHQFYSCILVKLF